MMQSALALAAALVFVAIHLFVGRLKFLSGTPRSRWLSVAGGVSVAYVFVHLLPELSEAQDVLSEATQGALGFAEHHVYLIALAGLVAFFGLDRLATRSRRQERAQQRKDVTAPGVFGLHIASFALYNALIGYLLVHRETSGTVSLLFFALAMALHFLVSDYGLREHHKGRYDDLGRWILCAAILGGLLIAMFIEIHRAVIAVLLALLAGAVILNVMKEELPEERDSRFSAFLMGAGGYAALLLAI